MNAIKEKIEMYKNIERHGANLNKIFNTGLDNVKLCKKLRRLEIKAAYYTTLECNTGDDYHAEICKILTAVKKILFPTAESQFANKDLYLKIFINRDPRGYALKIKNDYVREHNLNIYKDWGGYGILSPDFTPSE